MTGSGAEPQPAEPTADVRESGGLATSEFVPPGHFYSAIPSPEDIEDVARRERRPAALPGVDLDDDGQLAFLELLAPAYGELDLQADAGPGRRYGYANPNFGRTDAILLASALIALRPRRVVEVGSGDSTCLLLDVRDHFLGGELEVTLIEPHPAYVRELLGEDVASTRLLSQRLQTSRSRSSSAWRPETSSSSTRRTWPRPAATSTGCCSRSSRRLRQGVVVHVHDVFFPFEYPLSWLREGRAWNELYALRAFLTFNSDFEVLLFGDYAVERHRPWFARHMALCLETAGGSLWLRRTRRRDDC